MPTHYVDTYHGSDSNSGDSWGQAWRSCFPLAALYGAQASVQGLEVRFAKTPPLVTAMPLQFTGSNTYTHSTCSAIARPLSGYRKAVVPDYSGTPAAAAYWGATVLSPFWSNTEATSPAFRPAGTHKFRLDAPANADGLAARWPVEAGGFSAFHCFEFVASFRYYHDDEEDCPAELWLEFSSDAAGSSIVWSRRVEAGANRHEARMCLVGDGDLPASAAYAFLRIKNPTAFTVHLDCSSIYAVLPASHPNYVGLRLLYVPNEPLGTTLAPVSTDGNETVFNGCDGAGIDRYRELVTAPARTWAVYLWEPFPYPPKALLRSCSSAGTASDPLVISGGWNTTTGEVDGLSAIDAANLRWFHSVRKVSIDIRNLAVTFRRTGVSAFQGTPGIMEYAGYGQDKQMPQASAYRVFLPTGGAGCVAESIGLYYSDARREALLTMPEIGGAVEGSRASVLECNTSLCLPFFGGLEYAAIEDSAWGFYPLRHPRAGFTVRRCCIREVRYEGVLYTGHPVTFSDCDIVASLVSDAHRNGYACSPPGYLEDCRLWGAHTGPRGAEYPSRRLVFHPLPGVVGAICTHGADIDGLLCPDTDPLFYTADSMFARTGYAGDPVWVTLRNANVQMVFANFVPPSTVWDTTGHDVTLDNVTLHKTPASVGAPFRSAKLAAATVTLVGSWPSLQEGVVRTTEVDGLVITDAETKLVHDFSFAAPAGSWGRVCASYRNVVHPVGLAGFLGAPAATPYQSAAAGWFHTLQGEMWASTLLTVQKDMAVSHSGLSSWRMTPLQPIGAISAGSFMLGALPVVAGRPVTFRARLRRSAQSVLGGLFLRPGLTREWLPPGTDGAPSLHDIVVFQSSDAEELLWEQVSVTYTPARDGLVEMHAGLRGSPGGVVWLDSFEVQQ